MKHSEKKLIAWIAFLLFAAFNIIHPAYAERASAHAKKCITKDKNKNDFLKQYPTAVITDLPHADTLSFLQAAVVSHPEQAFRLIGADVGQVFQVPGIERVVVTIFKKGCIDFNLSLSPETFQNYMTGNPT